MQVEQVDAAIAAARTCLGTPFHHQGRAPGVGLDCIGLDHHSFTRGEYHGA